MNFIQDLGTLEYSFIIAFLVIYVLYIFRTIRISKVLAASKSNILFKIFLRTTYFVLILIAILGPYIDKGKGDSKVKAVSKDIFIALDLSLSMNADDVAPSRLERAKYAINKVLKEFSTDKIGLIVFSSDAFLQCPLTFDKNALKLFLSSANSNIVPHSGTDLFKPLNLALQKHTKNENTENNAKIVIVVSDGEDFGENMSDIADEINDEGIKVFTLGVGTKKGGKILHRGRIKRDKEGNDVVTTLNAKAMKKLAKITKGKYYEINQDRSDIQRMINDINNIKGQVSDVKISSSITKNLKYQYFLFAAVLLILIDSLITVRIFKI